MNKKHPQIYVACLAAYNQGHLHGNWIDADQEPDELQEEVNRILSTSPVKDWECCEEWAIHDYDDMPSLGEYVSLQEISDIAKAIAEHGDAYQAYIGHVGLEFANLANFKDLYIGKFDSEEDFVIERVSETWEIPDHLSNYIDYEKIAVDWFINDYYFSDGHVFYR